MPFCTKCGNENVEDAAFCTSCGAPLADAGISGIPVPPPPPSTPAGFFDDYSQSACPAATGPSAFSLFWNKLDLGSRIAGIGASVAMLAFFLPAEAGSNGIRLGAGDAAWWFRFLLAAAVIGMIYFASNNDVRTKVLVATGVCAVGALWGLQVFRIVAGNWSTEGLQFGWYAMHLGYLAMLVGGFLSVREQVDYLVETR